MEVSKIATASLSDFMGYFQVTLMNPKVLMGLFVGAMMSFMFCGLTMNAVGAAPRKKWLMKCAVSLRKSRES